MAWNGINISGTSMIRRIFVMAMVGVYSWVVLVATNVKVVTSSTGTGTSSGITADITSPSNTKLTLSATLTGSSGTSAGARDDKSDSDSPTVSLITSFWAQSPDEEASLHRKEIQAALLSNIHNPHLDQVVVILDGSSTDGNCSHFQESMDTLQTGFTSRWSLGHRNSTQDKLTCVDRPLGQPNYYEMFSYATDPTIVTSDIVILSNADQAFDDSAQQAKRIRPNTVLTLATWGYNRTSVPTQVQKYYKYIHSGTSRKAKKVANKIVANRCSESTTQTSWDGYVFYRQLIQGKLASQDFMRHFKTNTTSGKAFFKMNESGGENAGLWALLAHVPSARDANGCSLIRTWHFHGAKKMRAHNVDEAYWDNPETPSRVPQPYRRAKYPLPDVLLGSTEQ
ncbi:expressed unknown protein [Seminavis robusta]|uniref:Uncharacterized protein n=1 Tax=Seminavis robusta TaxID=568900 RepID=A0A9N8DXG2_9STRA|nr:expressed unknown protein [Seminavis robusta]|eukprot:Sro420_g139330.1 n/a (396) ;mRNA; r:37087-38274